MGRMERDAEARSMHEAGMAANGFAVRVKTFIARAIWSGGFVGGFCLEGQAAPDKPLLHTFPLSIYLTASILFPDIVPLL